MDGGWTHGRKKKSKRLRKTEKEGYRKRAVKSRTKKRKMK